MSADGAVVRFAAIFFRAESIHASFHAMKGYVELVKSRSKLVVIVEKCRRKCCAVPRRRRWRARKPMKMVPKRNGLVALAARISAIGCSTVDCIHAKRTAIRRT